MKFQKFISAALAGILLFSSIPVNVFAETVTNDDTVLSEDIITSGSAVSVLSTDIGVDFNVTGQWADGFNGEITITNLSDKVIENWQIQFEFSQEIVNIWNAVIVSYENSVYNIKNAGGNNNVNIPVGGSVTFGFTGSYDTEIIAPSNVELIDGREKEDNADYSVDFSLLSQWNDGYTAQITITNNTDTDMEAWHLEFDFGNEITSIWNAVIENIADGRYYISNAEYNSVIPANSSITFGFMGTGIVSSEPENYELIISDDCAGNTDNDVIIDEITNVDYYLVDIEYAYGDYAESVTQDLTLPEIGYYNNSTITWESSNTNLISSEGKVTRPYGSSQYVTLTATFTDREGVSVQKDFVVKVIKKFVEVDMPSSSLADIEELNGGEMPFIWIDKDTNKIRYIDGAYTDYIIESPAEAIYSLNALKDLYGIQSPMEEYIYLDYTNLDVVKRYRLQQVYKGIRVQDSNLIITTDPDGNIMSINGSYNHIPEEFSVSPENSLSKVNNIINAPAENADYELIIYEYENELKLCWLIYNINDGYTYIVEDSELEILNCYMNVSGAFSTIEAGKHFDVTTEKYPDIYSIYADEMDGVKYNVKKYVTIPNSLYEEYVPAGNTSHVQQSGSNYFLYTTGNSLYGTISVQSSTGEYVPVKFVDAEYGPYINNIEMFDTENCVMYLTADAPEEDISIAQYENKEDNLFKEAVSAYKNVSKAVEFFKSAGMENIFEISGYKKGTFGRPLYIQVNDDPASLGSLGSYSNNKKVLNLGKKNGIVASEKYDIIVHEMTHGLLYNKGNIINDTLYKAAIHEAYGDIMACIANNNWCFEEYNNDIHAETIPRNLQDPGGKFKTILTEDITDNNPDGSNQYYYSTILSHAAYKMSTDFSSNNGINRDLLAKIWYNSVSKFNNDNIDFTEVAVCVYKSAEELNCSENQLKTIVTAFKDAGIIIPEKQIYGSVKDSNSQKIYKYNIIPTISNDEYSIFYCDDMYILNIYSDAYDTIDLLCTSDGYDDVNKVVDLGYGIFEVKKEEIIFGTGLQVQTGNIKFWVYSENTLEESYYYTTAGIKVNVYDYYTGEPVAASVVDSDLYCTLNNIPYGKYYFEFTDDRELLYEAIRLKTSGIMLTVDKTENLYNVKIPHKYTWLTVSMVYEYDDGTEVPASNINVTIKPYNEATIWFKGKTDDEGKISTWMEIGKIYELYEDDEFFCYVEG